MQIELPPNIEDFEIVCSVSGGKDSAALVLALREAGVPARYVFADTRWEHADTYRHLDTMRERLGIAIDVVGVPGGMVARARHRAGFPARMQRWCTRELKLDPLRKYHDVVVDATGRETVNAIGVRGQESQARAKMPVYAFDDEWDGWCWRPLLHWGIADVLAIHHRHNLPMNPLYLAGHNRVGCYPCIYSAKEEIAMIARNSPDRIAEIGALEAEVTATRAARNLDHVPTAKRPLYYARTTATFFQARDRQSGKPQSILDVVDWAQTSRGGKQRLLFEAAPTGGCMRWGMCETPLNPAGQ